MGVEFVMPNGEGHVAQAQWVVVSGLAIFTGAQQEEKGDPNHLDGCGEFGCGGGMDESRGMVNDMDGQRFDAMWGRIFV